MLQLDTGEDNVTAKSQRAWDAMLLACRRIMFRHDNYTSPPARAYIIFFLVTHQTLRRLRTGPTRTNVASVAERRTCHSVFIIWLRWIHKTRQRQRVTTSFQTYRDCEHVNHTNNTQQA